MPRGVFGVYVETSEPIVQPPGDDVAALGMTRAGTAR